MRFWDKLAMLVVGIPSMTACTAARDVACPVIDVADHACEVLLIKYRDPQTGKVRTETVPKSSVVRLGEKVRLEREARDAGPDSWR